MKVAVLGTGRMASIHLAALATLRDRGLHVDGRCVSVEPALYGRNPARVRDVAEQYGVQRTIDLELRDPFELQLEQFLAGVVRGQPTTPDWADAVINQRLIKAAYLSATEHREVRLQEIASAVGAPA